MRHPIVPIVSIVVAVLLAAVVLIGRTGALPSSAPSGADRAATGMAMSTPAPSAGQAGTPSALGTGFVGSWQPIFTVAGQPAPSGLATFFADGNFVGAELPAPPHAVAANMSTSHGVWSSISSDTAALITISDQTDAQGHVVGTVTYRMRLTLIAQGQAWSGWFIAAVANTSGAVVTTFTGTVQAMRINLLPAEILPATPGATPQP